MIQQYSFARGFIWIVVYMLLALIPLGIALSGERPAFRSFWIEFGVALGFIGLAMFGLQFLFSGRFRRVVPTFGMDNIINYHREIGIIAFILVLAHPLILMIANPEFVSYFDPTVNLFRALALSTVVVALFLILATSLWRVTFGLIYEHWRLLHDFLALAIVFIGVIHSIQVSHYLHSLWQQIALALTLGACMYLAIHIRLVRPGIMKKHPYRITDLKEEKGESWTLTLEPEQGETMKFEAGQFAWITIGPTPFSLQQHPFSFASSASSDTIRFTAKEEGDFTLGWKHITPGTRAWLEGPFGSFTPKKDRNLFLIMGGIGITPAISMLRTMRDAGDDRKAILLYANVSKDDLTFEEELKELEQQIDLTVIHLLENPPENWEGEEGLVNEELLKKYMPHQPEEFIYYICGPGPMMDIAEISLRNLKVPWNHIYTERFQIV